MYLCDYNELFCPSLTVERKLSSQLQSNIKMLQKKLSAKCKDDVQKETLQKCLQELKDVFQNKSKKILEEFNVSFLCLFNYLNSTQGCHVVC